MTRLRGSKLTRFSIGLWRLVFGMACIASAPSCCSDLLTSRPDHHFGGDATEAAQKILHAELSIPTKPGALTLYYPKWMPADHSPGWPNLELGWACSFPPLANRFRGARMMWTCMPFTWRCRKAQILWTPPNSTSCSPRLAVPGIDFSASGTARLFVLMWNQVVLYPSGWPASQITFQPNLTVPKGWSSHTALPIAGRNRQRRLPLSR